MEERPAPPPTSVAYLLTTTNPKNPLHGCFGQLTIFGVFGTPLILMLTFPQSTQGSNKADNNGWSINQVNNDGLACKALVGTNSASVNKT